jgi:hypothetical protein
MLTLLVPDVILEAVPEADIPVNCDPLPKKKLLVTLPLALNVVVKMLPVNAVVTFQAVVDEL